MANGHATKKEVTTAPGALAAIDYGAYAGMGFETHTAEDYAVPFLGILQSNSPLVETTTAKPGMLLNTVTKETFDGKKGVAFIPAATQHVFVEWKPRTLGGGFVAMHPLDSDLVTTAKKDQEFGKYKVQKGNPNSNDLVETYYIYGILVKEDGSHEQSIIAFTSTKNAIYKQWMTRAKTIQVTQPNGTRIVPPLFAHRYRVTTIGQKNAKGSFFNFQSTYDGADAASCRLKPNDPLFLEAAAFSEHVLGNKVKAAHDTTTQESEVEAEGETPFK
jgi:hypothetical protein